MGGQTEQSLLRAVVHVLFSPEANEDSETGRRPASEDSFGGFTSMESQLHFVPSSQRPIE